MSVYIREMKEEDRTDVLSMMRDFYSSPAVLSNGSDEIFRKDIDECLSGEPYLDGFVFELDNNIVGYAMISKGFSTESGKKRAWIEDLYIKEKYRGMGIGDGFIRFVQTKYSHCVIRLEVEEENEKAVCLYKKCGFKFIPYKEMIMNE